MKSRCGTIGGMVTITFDAIEPPSEPIETLIADLTSPDPATRLAAVDRVSQWYYQNEEIINEVRPLILRLLADPDRSVQISAILAAGDALKDEAGTALIKTYEHSAHDRGVQLVAVKSMGRANTPQVIEHLRRIMPTADSLCIRVAARKALERLHADETGS